MFSDLSKHPGLISLSYFTFFVFLSTGVLKEKIQNVFNVKPMEFQLVCSDILLYYFRSDLHWRIQDSPDEGTPTPKVGALAYNLAKYFPKTA